MVLGDLPPWGMVYRQTRRWLAEGRAAQPSTAIFDNRTLQSGPGSGERASYDGAKRHEGSKVHLAVDTLGHPLALHVTPANEQDRAQVAGLARGVQEVTGQNDELAYAVAGYSGEQAQQEARAQGVQLEVVKPSWARNGFVLLPRR
ncbi:Transposase DDE domain protein [Calidithermus terrae]|uniref:Transposase DDE domain protein n=1 Tax=Calidithermus terrae TaxID=1408545 RepID=A0A399F5T9_9DEIN|nr:Transposase DDE domain protein [Calidithermus terrae]